MVLRFIAGATCPECAEMDSIQGELQEGQILSARCVACEWESDNPDAATATAAGNGHGGGNHNDDVARPVRILDPR